MKVPTVKEVGLPPPWTPEGNQHARAWYSAMLSRGPIAVDEHSGVWQFLGHDAVCRFFAQPNLWSNAKRREWVKPEEQVVRLLTSDPPLHKNLRAHFASAYRPQRIAQIQERVRVVCDSLLDACIAKGTFDVLGDFMKPLTVTMICEIIGIPEDGRDLMRLLIEEKASPLGRVDGPPTATLMDKLYAGETVPGYVDTIVPYFRKLIEARRTTPEDDLISSLAAIPPEEIDGFLDISALLFEQFLAGTNTTVHLFSSMLVELDARRDLLAQVAQQRDLVNPLIEETIRFHSPLQARPRVLTAETTINGVSLPEGTWALGWIGAANVDPAKFARPLEYDITRSPNTHIGFGYSEHFCLGSHLAKVELRTAMTSWLNKVEDFERAESGPLSWVSDFILHGLNHFNVKVKPRRISQAA